MGGISIILLNYAKLLFCWVVRLLKDEFIDQEYRTSSVPSPPPPAPAQGKDSSSEVFCCTPSQGDCTEIFHLVLKR